MTGKPLHKLRLFVAIELPPAWLESLAEVQSRMQAAIEADASMAGVRVRWTRPEGIHLTLKFIGEVEPRRLEAIKAQLSQALPEMPAIALHPGGVGSFADRRAPRVIWAAVRDDPPRSLATLAEGIETWLAAAGVSRERRGFRAHLTLARLPETLTETQRLRAVELTACVDVPEMTPFRAEAVSLMQSFIQPGGARYERLGRWPA